MPEQIYVAYEWSKIKPQHVNEWNSFSSSRAQEVVLGTNCGEWSSHRAKAAKALQGEESRSLLLYVCLTCWKSHRAQKVEFAIAAGLNAALSLSHTSNKAGERPPLKSRRTQKFVGTWEIERVCMRMCVSLFIHSTHIYAQKEQRRVPGWITGCASAISCVEEKYARREMRERREGNNCIEPP